MLNAGDRRALRAVLEVVPRRHLLTLLTVLFALSVVEGAGVLLLLPLLELAGVQAGGVASAQVTALLGTSFNLIGLSPTLGAVLGVYVAILAVQSTLQRWQTVLTASIQEDVIDALRRRVYEAVSAMQWVAFARMKQSRFLHVLTDEVGRAGAAAYYVIDLVASGTIAGVYFAIAFAMSPAVTAMVALLGLTLAVSLRRRLVAARHAGALVSESTSDLYAALSEHLASMKTAISFGAEPRHRDRFDRLSAGLRTARVRLSVEHGRFRQALAIGSALGLATIVYVSFGMLSLPTAELLVLLLMFARLMPRVTGLYQKGQALVSQLPSIGAVIELHGLCEAAARPPVATVRAVRFSREIRFDGVTFGYRTDEAPVLRDVRLTIASGTTTAIVGPSGAGKSTIADLVLGLIAPDQGQVLIDGEPLDESGVASWRRQIAYVPQETFIFHDTVRANLRWARPDATDDDVWTALRLAAAEDFIAGLPRGLDTVLGDRGVLVSGGERQRLALARALIRSPSLLVLDEATSALDAENERIIQVAIEGLRGRVTVLLISHRLSSVRHADRIYVLDRGRQVESGTWDELLDRASGRFRALCWAQGLDVRSLDPTTVS